jgi:hypothetical protein
MIIVSQKLLMDFSTTTSSPATLLLLHLQLAQPLHRHLQMPYHQNEPQQQTPPFGWTAKERIMSCYDFHPRKVTLLQPGDVECVRETKKGVKPGGTAKHVVFLCIQGNVTPDITLS